MTLTVVLVSGVCVVVALEACTAFVSVWLRKSCAWLITHQDRLPKIDAKGLDAFMEHGWDPQLGWVRKPNTRHGEMGRDGVRTSYSLDRYGARRNPGFENRPVDILAYGDSYTFARQVNDDEAWPHVLSVALDKNVANFGVGNYGIDQAQLRLEREFSTHPAKIVIMTVVPETICRIHSFWKHFSEYGNTFGFKPRFELRNGHLEVIPNLIDSREKYFQIDRFYDELSRNDYFYRRKFCHDILEFPFLLSLARSWKRNLPMMKHAFTDRIGLTRDAAFINVMKRNIDLTADLFHRGEGTDLFYAICSRFKEFCRANGAEPVLVMIPQLMDMQRIKSGDHYYAEFLEKVGREMTVIDLADELISAGNVEDLYIHDRYGGHLSVQGNEIVARVLKPICAEMIDSTGLKVTPDARAYTFAEGDLLANPNTYFYSDFAGHEFLTAWLQQRDDILAALPASLSAPLPAAKSFELNGVIETEALLENIRHSLLTGSSLDAETMMWVNKFLKKFEVFKRIHRHYDREFRAIDKKDYRNAVLYLLMGEVFELAYRANGALQYLNILLKINDTLCTIYAQLTDAHQARFAKLLENERLHVCGLADKVGVEVCS